MGSVAIVDRNIGVLGCLMVSFQLATKWPEYSPTLRCSMGATFLCYLSLLVLPLCAPRLYQQCRIPVILTFKAWRLLAPGLKSVHVRLHADPTGSWGADLFAAIMGLSLVHWFVAGLLPMPWAVWALQQVATLAIHFHGSLEQDCQSQLLSHPRMAGGLLRLHQAMVLLTSPLLPQARLLVPETQGGQCKAAVVFGAALLDVLLPAVLLVKREVPPPQASRPRPPLMPPVPWKRRVNGRIDSLLRALRFPRNAAESFVTWYVFVIVLWAASAMAF